MGDGLGALWPGKARFLAKDAEGAKKPSRCPKPLGELGALCERNSFLRIFGSKTEIGLIFSVNQENSRRVGAPAYNGAGEGEFYVERKKFRAVLRRT